MKRKVLLIVFVVVMIACCCLFFACDVDKATESTNTNVEIKCEANDSVFYLTFTPGNDEIRIKVPSLIIYKDYLNVYDITLNKQPVDVDVDIHWQTIDENGIVHSISAIDNIAFGDISGGYPVVYSQKRIICYWDITYKSTGETRRVTLIAEKQ